MASNKTTAKQLLLAAGLTAPWVADEPAELFSFCQCYACGEQFTRFEHTHQEVA
jgi:hypothetical protein